MTGIPGTGVEFDLRRIDNIFRLILLDTSPLGSAWSLKVDASDVSSAMCGGKESNDIIELPAAAFASPERGVSSSTGGFGGGRVARRLLKFFWKSSSSIALAPRNECDAERLSGGRVGRLVEVGGGEGCFSRVANLSVGMSGSSPSFGIIFDNSGKPNLSLIRRTVSSSDAF